MLSGKLLKEDYPRDVTLTQERKVVKMNWSFCPVNRYICQNRSHALKHKFMSNNRMCSYLKINFLIKIKNIY